MAVTEMLVKSGTHCATHRTNTENDSLCYKQLLAEKPRCLRLKAHSQENLSPFRYAFPLPLRTVKQCFALLQ